jgi:hypothetical protein
MGQRPALNIYIKGADWKTGKPFLEFLLRNQNLHAGIAKYEIEALPGISRIEREISSACLQYTEHRDGKIQRPLQKESNHDL